MRPFSIFAIFYMTAALLEMVETWEDPVFTGGFFILVTILVLTKITRLKFLFFLILATAYFLGFRFPEVANHVNLIIFCNMFLIAGVIYSLISQRSVPDDDDYFDMMLPYLRVTLIAVYFLTGFHKLNSDFFNPDVSCANRILHYPQKILESDLWRFPTFLFIAVGLGLIVSKLYNPKLFAFIKPRFFKIALIFGSGLILSIISILLIADNNISKTEIKELIVLATVALVLTWELTGGPLLTIPKFQAPILLVSWIMHSMLAMIGFVDFSSLAFTLLLTFIPKNYYEIINANAWVRILNYQIHRAHIYFILNAIGGILTGVHFLIYPVFNIKVIAGTGILLIKVITGILLNSGSIIFILPILSILFSPSKRPSWLGVPVISRKTPKFVYVFIVFLLLYGMTSYFGLRTAGNYSMFSNLRTEGEVSNHLLLKNNPLKIWTYQEDVVHFIEIDDKLSEIGYQYLPLKGNKLPVVEFRKLIFQWKENGRKIPLRFEYRGEIYETEDIVNDPKWRIEKRDWEMLLMDFRIIQPEGANKCRW